MQTNVLLVDAASLHYVSNVHIFPDLIYLCYNMSNLKKVEASSALSFISYPEL